MGKREIIYLSLHCHHQNDSCIKMSGDESHFNVSLTVRDKVTRQCPQTATFFKRRESRSGVEPRPLCLPAKRLTSRPNRLKESQKEKGLGRRNWQTTWVSHDSLALPHSPLTALTVCKSTGAPSGPVSVSVSAFLQEPEKTQASAKTTTVPYIGLRMAFSVKYPNEG